MGRDNTPPTTKMVMGNPAFKTITEFINEIFIIYAIELLYNADIIVQ